MSNRHVSPVVLAGGNVAGLVETTLVFTARPALKWIPKGTPLDHWLRGLVLRSALRNAYHRFARQHSDWVACLFDEHFLTHSAAPLLDRYVQRAAPPTAFDLATVWDQQLGPAAMAVRTRRIAELIPAAANFLTWLEADLSRSSLFD